MSPPPTGLVGDSILTVVIGNRTICKGRLFPNAPTLADVSPSSVTAGQISSDGTFGDGRARTDDTKACATPRIAAGQRKAFQNRIGPLLIVKPRHRCPPSTRFRWIDGRPAGARSRHPDRLAVEVDLLLISSGGHLNHVPVKGGVDSLLNGPMIAGDMNGGAVRARGDEERRDSDNWTEH